MNAPHEHVTITEITHLTAWIRRLSDAGPGSSDPAELAAFHAAKTTLLARIQAQHVSAATLPDPRKDTR
jgi:hypothetical protein